jgi:hypothetical protein
MTLSSTGDMTEQRTYSLKNLQMGPAALDLPNVNLGPGDLCFVAIVLQSFPSFAARVTTLNISGNWIFGSKPGYKQMVGGQDVRYQVHTVDEDQTGWAALCTALADSQHCQLEWLGAQDIGMGPVGLAQLAGVPMVSVRVLNLAHNKCFGVDHFGGHTVDASQSGWDIMCSAIDASPLRDLDISEIGMGADGLQRLARLLKPGRPIATTLTRLSIEGNHNLEKVVIDGIQSGAPQLRIGGVLTTEPKMEPEAEPATERDVRNRRQLEAEPENAPEARMLGIVQERV